MAVINTYVDMAGVPVVDYAKCTFCLRCVRDCPTGVLAEGRGRVEVVPEASFGCIGCLHCMAVCHDDAVSVSGRAIQRDDLFELPAAESCATAGQLAALLDSRRSVRRFRDRPVEREKLQQVIEAAASAPMGIPPSDVRLVVFDTPEKVHELAADNLDALKYSLPFLKLYLPPLGNLLAGRQGAKVFATFVYPLAHELAERWKRGEDKLLYDAPAALYFHGTPYADTLDVGLAACYAMLAAESLGLGTCLIGSLHPFLLNNGKLREKYSIPKGHKQGIVLILGYPAVDYRHAIRRRLGEVSWWGDL